MARARRLSRASGAGIISLEDQLGVIPGRRDLDTGQRLKMTVNMCVNATVRQVVASINQDVEEESSVVDDLTMELANYLRQSPLVDDEKAKELGDNIESSVVTVSQRDILPARVKAVREYTDRLNKEAWDWKDLVAERKKQYKNAEDNAKAATKGEIKVEDNQRFSLNAKEKAFFKNLPNYSLALAQVAAHERKQAVAAKKMVTETKRLKRKLEEVDEELSKAAKLVIKRADKMAEVLSQDPNDLFKEGEEDDSIDIQDILIQVEEQRKELE